MKKRRISSVSALLLLVGMTLTQSGCGGKSIPQYTADAGDAVKSFLDASKAMYDSGAINKDTYKKLLDAAETANKDTDVFKSTAVQLGVVTGDNKKPLVDKISDAMTVFRNVGNAQITDATQQAKFNAIIGAIQTAYTGILIALANIKKPVAVTPKIVAELQFNDSIRYQVGMELDRIDPLRADAIPMVCSIGHIVHVRGVEYQCLRENTWTSFGEVR